MRLALDGGEVQGQVYGVTVVIALPVDEEALLLPPPLEATVVVLVKVEVPKRAAGNHLGALNKLDVPAAQLDKVLALAWHPTFWRVLHGTNLPVESFVT
jgi:hypothetical protein